MNLPIHASALTSSVACLLFLSLMLAPCMANAADAAESPNDLPVVKRRIVRAILRGRPRTARIKRMMDTLAPDGSWPDIDYTDRSRSGWSAGRHLPRVRTLARAWRRSQEPGEKKGPMLEAAINALDHWLEHDYRNPNWWWNEIGVPRQMADILLLLEPELSEEHIRRGTAILDRADREMTGQNLVWLALIAAKRGILRAEPDVVKESFGRIAREIRLTTDEGIQPDYSFHQHGPCPYNHGYGAGFARDCSRIAILVRGTKFAFSREKVGILTRYVLDGSRWMGRGRWADPGADGREITRKGGGSCAYLGEVARHMLKLRTGRAEAFRQLLFRIKTGETQLTGNRHFWCSDFMTQHRPGYYMSARMHSTRTANTDYPANDEGLLSHHIADGATFIVRTGREYRGIMPVWDWQKIPGTTVVQKPALKGSPRKMGPTDFVGGVSDGSIGTAAFRLLNKRDALRARKTWFFFDESIVCLGAGISSSSPRPTVTTLNQCRLRGPVRTRSHGKRTTLANGSHVLTNTSWVHHDSVGYVFPSPVTVHLTNREETGNWWRINRQYGKEDVTEDLFTAWLDHGTEPRDANYAYAVMPGTTPDKLDARAGDMPVTVLRNAAGLQAVHQPEKRILQAAFYAAGRLKLDGGPEIRVGSPCLLMLRYDAEPMKLVVADPAQKLDEVEVRIRRRPDAAPFRTTIDLPDGPLAGSARSVELPARR